MIDIGGMLSLQGTLVLLVALGIFFRRRVVSDQFQKEMTDLIMDLILPCNTLCAFLDDISIAMVRESAAAAGMSMLIQLLCCTLALILFNHLEEGKKSVAQFGTTCSNAGFLGIPVIQGIFGEESILLGTIFLLPQRIVMWTVGVSYFTCTKQESILKKLLKTPCITVMLLGIALMVTGIRLPAAVEGAVRALGSCNTGMSMFVIGMLMANVTWKDFLDPKVLYYTGVRLLLIPLLAFLLAGIFRMGALAGSISVVLAAMPAAGSTGIMSARYGADVKFAGSCITVSTILSMVTVPLWCMILA